VKPSELAAWCRASGLQPEELIGMTYNPLPRPSTASGRDCDVNYLLCCVRGA
jgi:2-polyprenyl-6-hydroxyphenyl methylase/3-demethylubiquinone-9 3-methyltransferase